MAGDVFMTRAPATPLLAAGSARGNTPRRLAIVIFIAYRRYAMNDLPPPSPDDTRDRLATRLRALAHPARLAVLETLMRQDACMCGDIVRTLPLAQSTVSQHIKILADAGLIRTTAGPRPCYCIDTAALAALRADIEALFDGIRRGEPIAPDAEPASAASS